MNTLPRLRLYALALRFYPAAFRARYADEMLDAARHEAARSQHPFRFSASLAADTLRGVLREHLRAASPTRPRSVAAFALFFTVLLVGISIAHQQILRREADRFPIVLTRLVSMQWPDDQPTTRERIIAKMMYPEHALEISSPKFLDSALGFTVFYATSGHPIGGNAVLHGALPQPPIGIFNEIRAHDLDEFTWRPEPGIRIALSGRAMPNGGFVLAGQSLIPTEARTARLNRILLWIGAFAMLACAFLALTARRHNRIPEAHA